MLFFMEVHSLAFLLIPKAEKKKKGRKHFSLTMKTGKTES